MPIAKIVSRSVLTALVSLPIGAHAGTVDLNFSSFSLLGNSYATVGPSVMQQGFTITGTQLDIWQASAPSLPGTNPADTSLFDFYAGAADTLTATGGGTFTVNSIDLAPLIVGGSGTFNVTFTGVFADS